MVWLRCSIRLLIFALLVIVRRLVCRGWGTLICRCLGGTWWWRRTRFVIFGRRTRMLILLRLRRGLVNLMWCVVRLRLCRVMCRWVWGTVLLLLGWWWCRWCLVLNLTCVCFRVCFTPLRRLSARFLSWLCRCRLCRCCRCLAWL